MVLSTLRSMLLWTTRVCLISFVVVSSSSTLASFPDVEYPNITLADLAFGSCHKIKYAQPNLWPLIFERNNEREKTPQVWLWVGDAIYPPHTRVVASLENLKQEYARMKDPNNLTIGYGAQIAKHSHTIVLGTWDDHDYGGGDYGKYMPDKAARAVLFRQFLGKEEEQPEQPPIQQHRQGLYKAVTFGQVPRQVKIVILDTRWHRDDHCIPSVASSDTVLGRWLPMAAGWACLTRWLSAGLFPAWCRQRQQQQQQQQQHLAKKHATILGQEQWQWLQQQLLSDPNDTTPTPPPQLTLILSSIQVFSTNPAMEGWGHFPREQERLVQLLWKAKQQHNDNIYILSGDVHHGEIIQSPAGATTTTYAAADAADGGQKKRFSITEVTSSGLTHSCTTKNLLGKILCQKLLQTFHHHRTNKTAFYVKRNFGRIHIEWQNQGDNMDDDDDSEHRKKDIDNEDAAAAAAAAAATTTTKTPQPASMAGTVTITVHDAQTGHEVLSTGRQPLWFWGQPNHDKDDGYKTTEAAAPSVPACLNGHLQGIPGVILVALLLIIPLFLASWQRHGTWLLPLPNQPQKEGVPNQCKRE